MSHCSWVYLQVPLLLARIKYDVDVDEDSD